MLCRSPALRNEARIAEDIRQISLSLESHYALPVTRPKAIAAPLYVVFSFCLATNDALGV